MHIIIVYSRLIKHDIEKRYKLGKEKAGLCDSLALVSLFFPR